MRYPYLVSTKPTPQSAPLPGAKTPQTRNSAGGYGWSIDDWGRLDRFLILGSDAPTYYASARALTLENAASLERCLAADGPRVVARIAEISESGRPPKNDPAIFALAAAMKLGDDATRRAARGAVPRVCRIGTHLFALAQSIECFGGWGRSTRRAFADWYNRRDPAEVAFQAVKYQRRGGWSHRDLLRLSHPKAPTPAHDRIYRWITRGWPGALPETAPAPGAPERRIWALERARRASSETEICRLVREFALPRECVPSQFLRAPDVWAALLEAGRGMPITALVRNLGKMSQVGLLTNLSDATSLVVERLTRPGGLGRLHPLQLLAALHTYRQGRGIRGQLTWRPVREIVRALEAAFYASFQSLQPAGGRWMLALDVSGSMGCGQLCGVPGISPRVGSAAMAMATARTEQDTQFVGFSHRLVDLAITPEMRLEDVLRLVDDTPMGGTDCARPMLYASARQIPVDTFVVYTDSETWSGRTKPCVALWDYREKMGIPARLVVVAMTSAGFTIADPDDAGMLDVVGFDAAAPALIADFARETA